MKSFKILSIRYLKRNMRQSMLTVSGVVVATVILFLILNLGLSGLLAAREAIRENEDYEIILFTETDEQIVRIIEDRRIKTAYVGGYSFSSLQGTVTYDRVLYINLKNPYMLNAAFTSLCNTYGVEGEINYFLAWTYLQGDGGNIIWVWILLILLISCIFAIFGVGLVRNSIQLSMLENIRDYGNMRCIGASKAQLKSIIYMQGGILELTGIAIGVLIGTILSMLAGAILQVQAGFHILPAVFILIVFLGDLYFAMQENCKLVVNMTPVSAVRGEYRIQKETLRLRESRLIGKTMGVDGAYAYKSILRNPGRFVRTVGSLVFGIGAFMAVVSFAHSLNRVIADRVEVYGYYPIYFNVELLPGSTIEEVQSALPSTAVMERLNDREEITEVKRIYSAQVLLTDLNTLSQHYSEDYRALLGEAADKNYGDWREEMVAEYLTVAAGVSVYGYDESDYRRYQSALTAGTLDVSEKGIVIVNRAEVLNPDDGYLETETMELQMTDYRIGDSIDIVDMKELHDRIDGETEALRRAYLADRQQLLEQEWENEWDRDEALRQLRKEREAAVDKLVYECWSQLLAEGSCETYTIEGIVSRDVNHYFEGSAAAPLRIILPRERYFEVTGTDEGMTTGMQYHMSHYPKTRSLVSMIEEEWYVGSGGARLEISDFIWEMDELQYMKLPMLLMLVFIIFIMVVSALNIINTTASNLYLRRKEFAQLRVIGVSRKRLMRMVMLEGIITAVVADGIGIVLGGTISGLLFLVLTLLYRISFHFPIWAALGCIPATFLLLCGSIHTSLKHLKPNMAEDLTAGGD